MTAVIPARISEDGRIATWNPALTRSSRVALRIDRGDAGEEQRQSMNSGRARVREGERILEVREAS